MDKILYRNILNEWLITKKSILKDSSFISYASIINNQLLPYLGKYVVGDIDNQILRIYHQTYIENKSNNYKKFIYTIMINSLESFPKAQQQVKKFTRENINQNQIKKNFTVLSPFDRKKFVSIINNTISPDEKAFLLSYLTGMRIGEVCALRFKDVDIHNKLLYVEHTLYRIKKESNNTFYRLTTPKSKNSHRSIPIHEDLYSLLIKGDCSEEDFVITRKNRPMDPRVLRRNFKRFLEIYDLPSLRFHDLRHNFATMCIENGMDYKSLSEILGHQSISTTLNTYVHSNNEKKRSYINKI